MYYLFISPHLDDAVLSCGGLISKLTPFNKVSVITIFTGSPQIQEFSDIAQVFHNDCNLEGLDILKIRCNEDITASTFLGFNITHLGFLDCIYRKLNEHFIYDKRERIFSTNIYDDTLFLSKVHSSLCNFDLHIYDLIFVPLGLGNHIDHLITRKIVENISFQNNLDSKIRFYEDVPYCFYIEEDNKYNTKLVSYLEELSLDQLNIKLKGISLYKSQFKMFWNTQEEALNNFTKYSNKISNLSDKYYERYWKKKSS